MLSISQLSGGGWSFQGFSVWFERFCSSMWAAASPEVIFTNSSQRNTTGAEDWTEVYEVVRWIQLVMAVLSALGSSSIIVFAASQKLIRTPELQPLLLLSVSDLLLALCWLVGASLFSPGCSRQADCYSLHTAEQILYMASFLYTLNYTWSLYTGIRRKFHCSINAFPVQDNSRVVAASTVTALLSGVLPVLLMTPVFIQGHISQCYTNFSQPYRCLLMQTGALFLTSHHRQHLGVCGQLHNYRLAVFLTIFIITLTGIMVLMGKARHIFRRVVTSSGYLGDRQWASFRIVDRRMLLYPSVFIFCWGPAVCLGAMRLCRPSAGRGLAGVFLYILQALTSGSQGFLNCLVYGWTHSYFRSASRRVSFRDVDTQTPLLRSQKRSYDALRTTG